MDSRFLDFSYITLQSGLLETLSQLWPKVVIKSNEVNFDDLGQQAARTAETERLGKSFEVDVQKRQQRLYDTLSE